MRPFHTLIFDYGGTLDTDARHWSHVLRDGYAAAGLTLADDVWRDAYVHGERTLARQPIIGPDDDFLTLLRKKADIETQRLAQLGIAFADDSARQAMADSVARWCDAYVRRQMDVTRRVLDFAAAHYRLVLVSNFYGNVGAVLRGYGLDHYFPHIIESAVVGVRKPDPAIYRLGVEAAGCPAADCLVVGDSFGKDIVPATAVGCHSVWLRGEGWGKEETDDSLPDVILDHLADLPAWLEA